MGRTQTMDSAAWRRICPILITELDKVKDERLTWEARQREYKRKGVLTQEFLSHVQTLPSTAVLFLPSDELDEGAPKDILSLIEEDTDITDQFRERIRAALPSFIASLRTLTEQRKQIVFNLLPRVNDESLSSHSSNAPGQASTSPVDATLHLAASIFECGCNSNMWIRSRRILDLLSFSGSSHTGMEAVAHRCRRRRTFAVMPKYSEKGSQAAQQLLQLLGLNPTTTTALEMDRLNSLFMCKTCEEEELYAYMDEYEGPDHQGDIGITWRECVGGFGYIVYRGIY